MEKIIIEIPERRIKIRARNISEAIKKLSQLKESKSMDSRKIAMEFAGLFKDATYQTNEEEWYKQ